MLTRVAGEGTCLLVRALLSPTRRTSEGCRNVRPCSALGRLVSRRPWFVIVGVGRLRRRGRRRSRPRWSRRPTSRSSSPTTTSRSRPPTLQAEAFPDTNTTVGAIVVFDREDGEPLTAEDLATANQVMAGSTATSARPSTRCSRLDPSSPSARRAVGGPARSPSRSSASPRTPPASTPSPRSTPSSDLRDDLDEALDGTGLEAGVTGPLAAELRPARRRPATRCAIVGAATVLLIVRAARAHLPQRDHLPDADRRRRRWSARWPTASSPSANEIFDLKASSDVEVILFVVLYGIGTDYILFFLFRYRERLREGEAKRRRRRARARAGRRGHRLGRRRRDRRVHGAGPVLARHLPGDRPGARDRGRGHPGGRADPRARGRHGARPGALLAVEEVPRRARGRPASRAVGPRLGRHPARFAARLRRRARRPGRRSPSPSRPTFDLGDSELPRRRRVDDRASSKFSDSGLRPARATPAT